MGLAEERRQGGVTSVLAIDPGTIRSAWLRFEVGRPQGFGITANDVLVRALRSGGLPDVVVIEEIRSYGMAVGQETFDTARWTGCFEEAAHRVPVAFVGRKEIVVALCGSARASDSNVRMALIDRFGGKDAAIGRKASPGPLYGIAKDLWSALAIAVTYPIQSAG
jgi:hypothetical protein